MVYFFHTGRHLFFGAAIVNAGTLGAQAQRATNRVHCGVAVADDDDVAIFAGIERFVERGEAVRPH